MPPLGRPAGKDKAADGLRGVAALSVVLCHFMACIYPASMGHAPLPGGASPAGVETPVTAFLSIPWLSFLWNGTFAVSVFFVLSGYVLTKPFVETGDMSSMKLRAARRYPRLCIPILGSILLTYSIMSLGLSHAAELSGVTKTTWANQFWNFPPSFLLALKEGLYGAIFTGQSSYNPILWTMKVEFIGSMIVFGFRALNQNGRAGLINFVVVTAALMIFFPDEWSLYVGFLAGSYLGQLRLPQPRWLTMVAVLVAVFFGSYGYSRWYAFTSGLPLTANGIKNLMSTIGAVALLYVVRAGWFHGLFVSRPAQYLGKVSYAIYLVHFPLLLSFTAWAFVRVYGLTNGAYDISAGITLVVTVALVLATASAFETTFDRMGINVSKKLFPVPKKQGPTLGAAESA